MKELIERLKFGCPFKPGTVGEKDAEAAERTMEEAARAIEFMQQTHAFDVARLKRLANLVELESAMPDDQTISGCAGTVLGMIARKVEALKGELGTISEVLELKKANATRWRDRDDGYWLARLMQEVGELGSSIVGDHKDPPEHELRQIVSIGLNWLEKRKGVSS